MSAALSPVDEHDRLRSLLALDVLDSPPEVEFDGIVRAAAVACGVPISLVSLVTADRQWFKAATGLDHVRETPRNLAFCAHAIQGDDIFEVTDAEHDPRFADNPLVTGVTGLRFYAGAPLRLADGARVGTLCVIDRTPRTLLPSQREVLTLLGAATVKALESRRDMRRLAETTRSLQASEARFRVLSDGLPLGMFLADECGRLVHVNPRMQEILGLAVDECLGRGWHSVVHPDDLAAVRAEWRRVMPLVDEQHLTHRLLRRDGSVAHIHVRARPIFGADGLRTGFVGSVEDATARLVTARRLATSEAQLRWLYESTPAMLQSIDAQGRITSVSDRWLAKLGYRRDEVIGRPASDFALPLPGTAAVPTVDGDPPPHVGDPFVSGQLDDVPAQVFTRSGEILEARLSTVVERDGSGTPLRGVAVIDDVSERLKAERAVRDERRRLASIITGTGAGTWEWNVATGEQKFNESWAAIVGYTRADLGPLVFETWARLAHPDDFERAQAQLEAHFAGRLATYEAEMRLRHRDGHWVWVLSRGRVLSRLPDGSPEWMFGTHLDQTLRKQHEEALRKSESFLHRTGRVAGIGGWEFDLATGAMHWSDELYRMFERDQTDPPNLDAVLDAHAPASRTLFEAAIERIRHDGTGWDLELEVATRTGRRIWMRSVAEVESGADGRPSRIVGASQDITALVVQRRAVEQAKERLAIATESGGIGIWELDLAERVLRLDALACAGYGLPGPSAVVPLADWATWIHPDDLPLAEAGVRAAARGDAALDIVLRICRDGGSTRYLRATAKATRGQDGRTRHLIGASWDVSALRQLGAELAEQHELMRVTLQSIADAVITTDAAGRVTWLNPIAERMTGWTTAGAKLHPLAVVFQLIDEASRGPVDNPVAACLERGESKARGRPAVLVARDGTEYGVEDSAAPIRNEGGEVFGAVLVFRDVTEKRRLAAEMSHRAMHDALTGLVNRTEFEARLDRLLVQSKHEQTQHTLLFIDLDQFKLVNDACGHSVGDQLLQQVSRLLIEAVRSTDTVARLGGDEFAVIVEHCPAEQAERAAQSICDRMDDFRFEHGSKRFRVGASIGLVPLDGRWSDTAALMQAADTSCYAAKDAGRNRIHVWFDTDVEMRARHGEMKWATRLEQALDDGRFVLFAQRIEPIRPQPGDGLHAEALLRLIETDGSLVAPGAFLPAAERFHLSSRIDRWVLRAACDWLLALPDLAPIDTLCVNLSGQSIGDRAFHRHALDILAAAGEPICRRLCLEITETAAVTNLADAAAFIEKARSLGVRIALDDFGAGASSFGYLKKLKVDILKIDGQFIRDFLDDPLDGAAVRCFVDVARVMGLKTVAEFVDRPEVLAELGAIGVDYAQGYLLHLPEPIDRLMAGAAAVPAPAPTSPRPDTAVAAAAACA